MARIDGRRRHRGPDGTTHTERYLHAVQTCTSKTTYSSSLTARNAATVLGWIGKDLEAYRCQICDAWHLTSKRTA